MAPAGLFAFGSVACTAGGPAATAVVAKAASASHATRAGMTVEDMPQMRPTTPGAMVADSLPAARPGDPAVSGGSRRHRHSIPQATLAVTFAVLLLVLATTQQGAFAISRWAPLALFALALLLGALLVPRAFAFPASAPARLVVGSMWGLALWSLLSMLWAKSSGDAFQGADRMILYAAIVTLPFALPISRSSLAAVGWAVAVGIGAIALYVLIRMEVDGVPLFLAGRLNGPIDYRNGSALLFALPVWPFIIAAATRTNRRPVRAATFAFATLCIGLVFLTQSRGIVIGLALGACLALAAGPDRVRRAWVAILSVGGVGLASPWLLRPYHAFIDDRFSAIPHDITTAASALLVLTILAFVVGMMLALFDQGLRADSPQMESVRRAARIALAGVVVVGVIGAAAAIGNPVTFARDKWDQFRQLNGNTSNASTRLVTVGGQRYDLWRVALNEFASSPVLGVGADNYTFDYYRDRKTNRNLTDPHSLLFSLLSELGLVGTALFFAFCAAVIAALRRNWRLLAPEQRRPVIASAAGGAVLLGQSMVDWMWLIPGLTAIGLFLLSIAAAQATDPDGERPGPATEGASSGRFAALESWRTTLSRRAPLGRVAAAAVLVAAIIGVLALFLSDAYIQRARTVINDPPAELSAARLAASFDPWAVDPHYLQASAYETMGDRASAYRELRDALALEPKNFATLGLLGDFEARGHNFAAARRYYRRALALDPLDTGLQQLARIGEPASTGR